jgi:alanyl-tRNA synthetase
MTGNDIRKTFLDYFAKNKHQVVRSSSLVPQDDPTLLFVNAGMVQFKRTFLGEEKRNYNRATTSQKCVRAGGKHNDLENVGYTARHHTFFEMLGNFSFGDYFKEKAIAFGWDLLVNGYGLPVDKLLVSIYEDDDESGRIWQDQIGVSENRISRLGEADNFWSMGDTGPCGPCSEIHIDRGAAFGCGKPECAVGCDCDRFLEIWNLVFMQYDRDESGKLAPLPAASVDTGLGLERMASILQNTPTNYETDLIKPIMEKVEVLSEKAMGTSDSIDVAMKVIADHSRAAAFLIGDGILPSNEGRGYVLRRIMRRAIRYGRNIGLIKPFLHETAKVVFDIMQPQYPELSEASAFITNVIQNEENRFSETLDTGLRMLNDTLVEMEAKGQTRMDGDVIFKLYDTFGFPVDIVKDVLRDRDMSLDMDGFDAAMDKQREKSKGKVSFDNISDAYKKLNAQGVKAEFTGYSETETEAEVLLLVVDEAEVDQADTGSKVSVVTQKTPFYAESGGQIGDTGVISGGSENPNLKIKVLDTIKDPTGLIVHKGRVVAGRVTDGETVRLTVDEQKRHATALNHTATHILHAVLREVLGDHIKQAGSMVASDRLRFDFSHFAAIETETLEEIETRVNRRIRQNATVTTDEMDAETAFKSGATALFEEKYGDRVRVISLSEFSKELCGGTHTARTGDIGLFKIVAESSVASGVRRIEAVSGEAAFAFIQQNIRMVQNTARVLRVKPEQVEERVAKILANTKALEREAETLKTKIASKSADDVDADKKNIDGVDVIVKRVEVENPAALRDLADRFKDKLKSGVVVLGTVVGGKVLLIAIVTKDLTKRFHAGNIVKQTAAIVGGGGGGRPDMAQAGGTKPEMLDKALEKALELIKGD